MRHQRESGTARLRGAPLAALALYAFEQISTAGVLTIIAVEVVASIVYFAQIARMQRIM